MIKKHSYMQNIADDLHNYVHKSKKFRKTYAIEPFEEIKKILEKENIQKGITIKNTEDKNKNNISIKTSLPSNYNNPRIIKDSDLIVTKKNRISKSISIKSNNSVIPNKKISRQTCKFQAISEESGNEFLLTGTKNLNETNHSKEHNNLRYLPPLDSKIVNKKTNNKIIDNKTYNEFFNENKKGIIFSF